MGLPSVVRDGYSGRWSAVNSDGEAETFNHEQAARAWSWGDLSAYELDSKLDSCRVHHLKLSAGWFGLASDGVKNCEIRLDDRCFEVGDELVLHEVILSDDAVCLVPTGRMLFRKISAVLKSSAVDGLKKSYVILCFGGSA